MVAEPLSAVLIIMSHLRFKFIIVSHFRQYHSKLKASTQQNEELMQVLEETSAQLKLKVHLSVNFLD